MQLLVLPALSCASTSLHHNRAESMGYRYKWRPLQTKLILFADLNYCGRHEPCKNGGTCENPAPDQYSCTCRDGFSGPNCEVIDNPCAPQPCANGGTCTSEDSTTYRCDCAPGWAGDNCRISKYTLWVF